MTFQTQKRVDFTGTINKLSWETYPLYSHEKIYLRDIGSEGWVSTFSILHSAATLDGTSAEPLVNEYGLCVASKILITLNKGTGIELYTSHLVTNTIILQLRDNKFNTHMEMGVLLQACTLLQIIEVTTDGTAAFTFK